MASLSVVIPAYNEEDGISAIMGRVLAVRPSLEACGVQELEVIVVDDGSQDRTCEIVAGNPAVRLVKHGVNRGYGAALKTGFRHARGELLAFLDADGTYPPECFPQLCQPILEEGADLVIGSRMTGTESEMPLVRRVGNTIFANLVSLLGNHRISDSASGMRVFRQEVLAELYPLPDGLNFTPVMSTRALHERIKMVEVPITYSERVGRSKLSVVRDGLRFANSIVWTAMSYNPVRVLGMIGVFAVFLAVAVGIGLVALRLQGVTTLGHWGVFSVYTALVMGVSGVSLFSLGATFNYLVSLFHKRPVRQGLFGKPIFTPSLDHHFGWIGLLAALAGILLGGISFSLGLRGWDVTRLWLYLLGSALLVLMGLQLIISWLVMRVLEDLSEREIKTRWDLEGA
jgi:glycosyltransferase involved in cell wall biosynthesis